VPNPKLQAAVLIRRSSIPNTGRNNSSEGRAPGGPSTRSRCKVRSDTWGGYFDAERIPIPRNTMAPMQSVSGDMQQRGRINQAEINRTNPIEKGEGMHVPVHSTSWRRSTPRNAKHSQAGREYPGPGEPTTNENRGMSVAEFTGSSLFWTDMWRMPSLYSSHQCPLKSYPCSLVRSGFRPYRRKLYLLIRRYAKVLFCV